ncbi:hypothetical protein GCM10010384_00710 [Streptomyces djakartensis]|uniref:Transposase n=1 Tax=Streptomyces djakartensis TaxID=68193 RepID=A0ABQ2Z3D1_9ACTN|nr:hypothetical protein GCM10010384_00710 [Streptomyces djakartensis]
MTPGRLRGRLDLTSGVVTACLDRPEPPTRPAVVSAARNREVVVRFLAEMNAELALLRRDSGSGRDRTGAGPRTAAPTPRQNWSDLGRNCRRVMPGRTKRL